MTVAENLRIIDEKIEEACRKSGRRPEEVTVIAVTKYVGNERAQEAVDCGLFNLAENRKEGLLEKQSAIHDGRVVWHLIGTLQTRKVKDVVGRIDYFHALDRLKLAAEINKRMKAGKLKCFIEMNLSGEASKHGIAEEELDSFIEELGAFEHIQVIGLMTMAPNTEDTALIRKVFRGLRQCRDRIRDRRLDYAPCTELSMGMSHDFQIAVEEGATFVRIGTSLVGNEWKGS
ncbi:MULTISPECIES: YggS family pyridoxal phosphate-dependent enzyme [unclassified Sporolactobacillus]|uniref:YggS family pyridoxal phosphate-dependent enzyme n=1 Tax=unclassified Sporolactobacillus TaxID=2628533 RepID=UPI002368ACE3|nr:YggS family pyridoxal phosphate-dependent enzyme [Sporolactobacillus sp. CQH2019]MDD9147147.1 YggS family pyridoxal phosphate-dependent enzyme [Sporolactobacillus sp. CQH2019]